MAPQPKKRHSSYRKGKRRAAKSKALGNIVYDKNTGRPRLSHRKSVTTNPTSKA